MRGGAVCHVWVVSPAFPAARRSCSVRFGRMVVVCKAGHCHPLSLDELGGVGTALSRLCAANSDGTGLRSLVISCLAGLRMASTV